MLFLKKIFNLKKNKKIEEEQPNVQVIELPFTKEEIYKEFNAILKENPGKMDEECLKRIKCVEILDMKINADKWISINFKTKYNNNVYENEISTSDIETPKKWAKYFYERILQNYNPQENDPKIKELIRKAGKEARKNLIFKRKTLGYCHLFWGEQKRILKDKYGIDWKSPTDRNPDIRYD